MNKTLALVENVHGHNAGLPLGCLCLASYVKRHAPEWDVRVVDGRWEDLDEHFRRNRYDVIGISAMTNQYEAACRLARSLAAGNVILGGPHITACPESLRPGFAHAVYGEGEIKLVRYLKESSVDNTPEFVDLSDYPDLDYSLLSPNYWTPTVSRSWHAVAVSGGLMTTRGCPYRCRFCSSTLFWQRPRFHSPEWVIRQIQSLVALGVTHIGIYDDLFTVNAARLTKIAELFEAAGLRRQIREMFVQCRANLLDDRICELLRSMNVGPIHFGFESGDDRVVRYLKRDLASVALNKQAVRRIQKFPGLKCFGSLMIGSPTETGREMLMTAWFILWCFAHGVVDLLLITSSPLPGTEFWQIALQKGKVSPGMDFNRLKLHYWKPGPALLIDMPRWKFVIFFYIGQCAMLTIKGKKAFTMALSALKSCFRMQ